MKSRVSIGYQVDFPPFMQVGDPPTGLLIDALSPGVEALQGTGVIVDWVPLTLADQVPALTAGRVDLLAGLGVTAERARAIVFGETLVRTGGALFVRRAAGSPPSPGANPNPVRRIVTPSSGPLREPTRAAFPDCGLLDADDYPDALAQVLAGRADAAALNRHVGMAVAERQYPGQFELPQEPFAVIELAPAYAPDHDGDLKRLLDEHSRRP